MLDTLLLETAQESALNIKKFLSDSFYENKNHVFTFDEPTHTYTLDGLSMTSATTFVSRFHEEFNTKYWSERKAFERGVPVSEILEEWSVKNKRSLDIGSPTHEYIENYYNTIWQPIPEDPDVLDRAIKFMRIYSTHLYKMVPVCFEQRVFHKKWRIAGTFDALFLYNNKLFIFDWKTNKEFTTDSSKKFNNLFYPFDKYYENHLNEYSIQLSLYGAILKDILGIDITAMYLCHIGPDRPAVIHKCIDFRDLLTDYLNSDTYQKTLID